MRHGKKFNHLKRKTAHRKAMLANMACSLIEHKRIKTTLAKGKALRKYVEPLLTKAKTDTTHSRRVVFSYLKNKEAIKELFGDISNKIANRPGGYTRIIKTGFRLGDGAEMCIIELVDYNDLMLQTDDPSKKKTRRSRRRKKKGGDEAQAAAATTETATEEVKEEAQNVVEEVKQEATETVEEVKQEATDVVEEVKEEAQDVVDEATSEEPKADDAEEPKKDEE